MSDGLKVSGSGSIYESLSFNTNKKQPIQASEDLPNLDVIPQDTRTSEKQNTGRVPSSSISFESQAPIQEQVNSEYELPNLDELAQNKQPSDPNDLPVLFEDGIPSQEGT
ncbi:MAG: hypothetical protein ACK4IX_18610, partial [Candidatus Sericytochromatia bacterium]